MSSFFFPNQAPETMRLERDFRALVETCTEPQRYAFYALFAQSHAPLVQTRFDLKSEYIEAYQSDQMITFPRAVPMVILSHIVCGYEAWLNRKYALPGFVEVETGDVVVDCGAYVGGFSLSAARIAKHVHVFEPERQNFCCVERNLMDRFNATLNSAGLYSETKVMPLNISDSGVEHSILDTDDGVVIRTQNISVLRLDDYCNQHNISQLDFVKIEAEGVELEVFEGLGNLRPRKLAIDVSEERNGESPAKAFHDILSALDYEVKQRGHVLFARLP